MNPKKNINPFPLPDSPSYAEAISRRQMLQLLGAGLLGGALAGCGTSSPSADAPVKIGYLPITDATPLLVAYHNGYFTEEGLTAEAPTMLRDWSQLSETFMARTFNLTHLLLPITIFMRYSLKYPVKVMAWDHMNNSAITVRQDGPINSLADLGGKQIAIPYWYSIHNIIIQLAARTFGLKPVIKDSTDPLAPDEMNLLVMKPPDMPTALGAGAIDGYIVAEPFNAAGEVLANGKIIRFTGDIWKNHPCCVAVLHEESLTQTPTWAQKIINALVKAELWSHDHKEEVAHLLSADGSGYLPLPEEIIRRAMLKYDLETYGPEGTGAIQHPEWGIHRIGFSPYQFQNDTRRIVELLKETTIKGEAEFLKDLSPELVVQDLMEYTMVTKAIEKAGGMQKFDGDAPTNAPYERDTIIDVLGGT